MTRPHSLNAVIGTKPDGTKITTRSAILEWLEQPLPANTAYAHAGISATAVNIWIREAARAQRALEINPKAKLTPHDRDLIVFARQVDEARARGEARMWNIVNTLASGGLRRTRVTVKEVNGVVAERQTVVEEMLPSLNAAKFMLQSVYGHTTPLDERENVITDDEAAAHLADAVEHWLTHRDADSPNTQPTPMNGHNGSNGNGAAHNGH
jgi:hypothetical protein